jgi:choline-glycine betaine transporter
VGDSVSGFFSVLSGKTFLFCFVFWGFASFFLSLFLAGVSGGRELNRGICEVVLDRGVSDLFFYGRKIPFFPPK